MILPQAMFAAPANTFPQGGYYIAAPYPGPSSSATSTQGYLAPRTTCSPSSTHAQGFVYGPYSYPYTAQPGNRVVGPVLAVGVYYPEDWVLYW